MRILVTGVTGFAGSHLAETLLRQKDAEIVGLCRTGAWPPALRHLADTVRLFPCDLGNPNLLRNALREIQPHQVYHLAGFAHAGASYVNPDAAWAGNLTATRNLYDAVWDCGYKPRILYVGSGMVYGDSATSDHAHDETCPLLPANPYAASKAAADLLSYQCTRHPGLDVVRVRPFNHSGPRQSAEYVTASFAKQIAAIERGTQPPILETGDLRPLRDLTDVRDTVRAYVALMDKGRTGEVYNVASGAAHSMRAVLDGLLKSTKRTVEVRQAEQRVRPGETSVVLGDAGRLRAETGWDPAISFERMLADALDFWRNQP